MPEIDVPRRTFLRGVTAATALSYSRVYGANERVQLGLIGAGERGRSDMGKFVKSGTVDVAAVCDIYAPQIDAAQKIAPKAQGLQRPSQAAGDERSGRRADRRARSLARGDRHRRAERGQGRLRREAADAEDRGRSADREGRARQQPHLPGGHAAALRQALPGGQARVHGHRQVGQDHAGPHLVARQRLSPAQGAGVAADAAQQSGLGALPGSGEVARLGSAAVLELARVSGFRRRPGDRPVHALDRRGAHVHGRRTFRSSASASGGVYNYKDGRTAPDTINVLLEYPQQFTATFEATLVPGITGAAVEICGTQGRLWIDRSRYEFTPVGRGAQTTDGAAPPPIWTRTTSRTSWIA